MTLFGVDTFSEVWCCDFEFQQPDGERPRPFLMCAHELRTGFRFHLWMDELTDLSESPISNADDALFVAYFASAELGSYRSLGWSLPSRILDLYVEFRCITSGLPLVRGAGLVGAMSYFGIGSIDLEEKDHMRELAMRGGPYTGAERRALIDYCFSDVDALAKLLPAMLPKIDVPRALLRGRYMGAVARMERTGVPIDVERFEALQANWGNMQGDLIAEIDANYGVYEGHTFKRDRFAQYLVDRDIPWPRLASGALDLSDGTFRQMSKTHSELAPLRELRYSLSQLRLNELAVGADGRNRCLISPFGSTTGRNTPSSKRFIFGPSVWLRGLIKPGPGRAVAYIDYEQQEFGIAAALSGDKNMKVAYRTGDPYLSFAKQVGAVPEDATKQSHTNQREQFKQCVLAVQYGMSERGLAQRIGCAVCDARELLRLHNQTYSRFWQWSEASLNHAMLLGSLHTVFGWQVHVGTNANPRSLMNFPMQANGAEMLRLACCLLTERGIRVCAPIHDAVLIEADIDDIDNTVARAQNAMREASETVLDGFPLRTDVHVVRYPDRYMDKRGQRMWDTVMEILGRQTCCATTHPTCGVGAT